MNVLRDIRRNNNIIIAVTGNAVNVTDVDDVDDICDRCEKRFNACERQAGCERQRDFDYDPIAETNK